MRRFIVIQVGARMHYAVPALLAQAGMLERFYTDIHGGDGLVRWLRWLPAGAAPAAMRRLAGRQLPAEIPRTGVRSCPVRALLAHVGFNGVGERLGERVLREGFGDANAIYSLSNGDEPVLRAAKQRGLFTIHEQILNPDVGWILREERERFPGLEVQDSAELVEEGIRRDLAQWRAADRILVPSEFVADGAIRIGADPSKVALVPYGIPSDWLTFTPQPVPGRVLFVGSVGLRKGVHYLAEAARLLQERGSSFEVRVAGPVPERIVEAPLMQGPLYLGQIPRTEIRSEFLKADVFVIPTLSDSFALVHLEAMACGVPVITTPNCGSVVRDGVDGFIVPIRDARALAEKIELLVTDRRLREEMSHNARERAREYTWPRYEERLLAAFDVAPIVEATPDV